MVKGIDYRVRLQGLNPGSGFCGCVTLSKKHHVSGSQPSCPKNTGHRDSYLLAGL